MYKLEIIQDEWAESPRKAFECLGTFECFPHHNYNCGDSQSLTRETLKKLEKRKDIVSLPVYMYDHGGIAFSTSPFSCRWDSGRIGVIYVEREKILSTYKVKKLSKKIREKVSQTLELEIQEYDRWNSGEVYMYTLTNNEGEIIDSSSEIYDSLEDIEKNVISIVKNNEPRGFFPGQVKMKVERCSLVPNIITIDISGYVDCKKVA